MSVLVISAAAIPPLIKRLFDSATPGSARAYDQSPTRIHPSYLPAPKRTLTNKNRHRSVEGERKVGFRSRILDSRALY
jgi:hypothetical protein